MNIREKIYTEWLHLRLTVEQSKRLEENASKLKLKQREFIRRIIMGEFIYVKYLGVLIMLAKRQGNLLNQIAKHCNETQQAGDEILPLLRKIDKNYELILNKIERLKK
jgi:hypothetical protein